MRRCFVRKYLVENAKRLPANGRQRDPFEHEQIRSLPLLLQQRRKQHAWTIKSTLEYRKHRASGQAIVTLDAKDFSLGP